MMKSDPNIRVDIDGINGPALSRSRMKKSRRMSNSAPNVNMHRAGIDGMNGPPLNISRNGPPSNISRNERNRTTSAERGGRDISMDRVGVDGIGGPAISRTLKSQRKGRKSTKNTFRRRNSKSDGYSSYSDSSLDVGVTATFKKEMRTEAQPESDPFGLPSMYGTGPRSHRQNQQYERQEPLGLDHEMSLRRARDGYIASLKDQGFSTGLAVALSLNVKVFDRRIWIVDNSGSMEIGDGHRVVTTCDQKIVAQAVTRWDELKDTILYHAEMAAILKSPTLFKLLNAAPGIAQKDFAVGAKGENYGDEIREARTFMNKVQPIGPTPLANHIWNIQKSIHRIAPKLRRENRQVVVVLATDGLPTDTEGYVGEDVDSEFLSALRALEGLPVWLVIRLCTDEEKVKKFYNDLDGKVELNLEVIDDFIGEAEEVRKHNRWLNYCLPMHRCRELGYHNRVFDFLDERPLTRGELRDFCAILFGSNFESIPDPNISWTNFLQYVQHQLELEDEQWHPLKKKKCPWISLKMLNRIYGKGNCVVM